MMCYAPYHHTPTQAFGCGQCLNCRINKRRTWAARILLEASQYANNSFCTLTYRPENQPEELVKADLSDFLRRIRDSNGKVRFFAVGEYGENGQKAHYHAVLFGFAPQYRVRPDGTYYDPRITSAWRDRGITHNSEMTQARAHYVAGYTTKKWTQPDHPDLDGRVPEFSRMSRKPAIGVQAYLDFFTTEKATRQSLSFVPDAVRINGSLWPIGRTLKRAVSEHTGLPVRKNYEGLADLASLDYNTKETLARKAESRLKRQALRRMLNGI